MACPAAAALLGFKTLRAGSADALRLLSRNLSANAHLFMAERVVLRQLVWDNARHVAALQVGLLLVILTVFEVPCSTLRGWPFGSGPFAAKLLPEGLGSLPVPMPADDPEYARYYHVGRIPVWLRHRLRR